MEEHRVGTGGTLTLELLADYLGHEANNVLGAIGCIGAGLIGAFVWGFGFGGPHGMTSSWLAMVIGFLIAIFCIVFRGRGTKMAILAAVVALVAIFGGRFFGGWVVLNREWGYRDRMMIAREIYKNTDTNAEASRTLRALADFKQLKGDAEYPALIVKHNFEIGEPDGHVSETELAEFKQHWAPLLKRWAESLPKSNELAGQVMAVHIDIYEAEFKANTSITDIATYDLNFVDVFFALLGAMVSGAMVMLVSGKLELRRQATEKAKREKAERAPLPKLTPVPGKKKPVATDRPSANS
jgi:hypothetical protein